MRRRVSSFTAASSRAAPRHAIAGRYGTRLFQHALPRAAEASFVFVSHSHSFVAAVVNISAVMCLF